LKRWNEQSVEDWRAVVRCWGRAGWRRTWGPCSGWHGPRGGQVGTGRGEGTQVMVVEASLRLTGQLGPVMRESAELALS
jgi:hypothetical protein